MFRISRTLIFSTLISASLVHAAVTNTSYEDIADGAVWESANQQQSLLIATLEGDGIAVYNAEGKEVQRIVDIEALGADVRYSVNLESDQRVDLAAVALPNEDAFAFFIIDSDSKEPLYEFGRIKAGLTPEGVCLSKNPVTGSLLVAGFDENGRVEQYKLRVGEQGVYSLVYDSEGPIPVRTINVGGELSACAIDDESGTMYIAEQNVGVWVYGSDPENVKDRKLLDIVEPIGHLEEIEGMDIVYQSDGHGFVVIADEGKGFLIYDRANHKFKGRFDVEGVEEAKLVVASLKHLWIGNTEAEEPVYQTLSWGELSKLSGYKVINSISQRDLDVSGVELVRATGETTEVDDDGDAADDSAIWYNEMSPEQSLIIATNKQGGLMAYKLDGSEVQYLEEGEPNNVDIRQNIIDSEGNQITLAAVSNRQLNTLALYSIDGSSEPIKVLPAVGGSVHSDAPELASNVDEVYGLCMARGENGTPYVFINGKGGQIEQWRIDIKSGRASGKLVRTLSVASQPEGCVVDDKTQTLYVGEEDKAIWAFDARESGSTEAKLFAGVDGVKLVDDIEGLTIYQTASENLLIASSQGNNTYSVFDLNRNGEFVKSFAVIGDDNKGIDGATDTDGIHALSLYLGKEYPEGIFLVQDWYNIDDKYQLNNQNFKLVDWRNIKHVLN